MPLPMQGDKLLPSEQNITLGGLRPGAPDRRRGDAALDAPEQLGKAALGEFGRERRPLGVTSAAAEIVGEMMGENIDQGAFELLRIGVAEFGLGELLKVFMQQPGVIERRLQDQRFPARDRRAMAAMQRP